jgi:glycerophosphoryl diester phosphodiesterase
MNRGAFKNGVGPFVIGHRGASGYAPENTMVSFERALALRADAIELDIHPTSDGKLAVIHDPTLERTTNGKGLVCTHSYSQLQELDAGSWFDPSFSNERIPLLDDVLSWAHGRTKVVIEVKQGPIFYPNIAELLLAALERTDMRNDVMVISFDHHTVRRVKELASDITTGVLYAGRCINPVMLARDADADVLLPYWALLTKEEVDMGHEAGLMVAPWGGPEQDYRFILPTGVDAVAADFPDRPRELLESTSL